MVKVIINTLEGEVIHAQWLIAVETGSFVAPCDPEHAGKRGVRETWFYSGATREAGEPALVLSDHMLMRGEIQRWVDQGEHDIGDRNYTHGIWVGQYETEI